MLQRGSRTGIADLILIIYNTIGQQIQMLSERKQELERRLQSVIEERDNLTLSLEESMERIHVLERHTREQDIQIRYLNTYKVHLASEPQRAVLPAKAIPKNWNGVERT